MDLTTEQRKAIASNCLPSSWQMTTAWRLQHQGAATDTPDVLVDWLHNASPRSQSLVLELVRHLSDRLWRLELRPRAAGDAPGLRSLDVVCGGLRWTLWLQARPQLYLVSINR
jgi:hypothetical protein